MSNSQSPDIMIKTPDSTISEDNMFPTPEKNLSPNFLSSQSNTSLLRFENKQLRKENKSLELGSAQRKFRIFSREFTNEYILAKL